jgi:hypothetical protein
MQVRADALSPAVTAWYKGTAFGRVWETAMHTLLICAAATLLLAGPAMAEGVKSNPLYQEDGKSTTNPLYKGSARTAAPAGEGTGTPQGDAARAGENPLHESKGGKSETPPAAVPTGKPDTP